MKELNIVLKRVGEEPIETTIENTLEAKQKLVGGLIEVARYPLDDEDLLIVCNEEGKVIGLKPNCLFDFDYIAGDFFVIGDDYKNGDFKSLTKTQVEKVIKDLSSRAIIYKG